MLEVPYGPEKNRCKTPLPFRNEGRDCLGRRVRAVTEPLRISRNIHILQYVETVNAPAEGAGRRGPVAPRGAVF